MVWKSTENIKRKHIRGVDVAQQHKASINKAGIYICLWCPLCVRRVLMGDSHCEYGNEVAPLVR